MSKKKTKDVSDETKKEKYTNAEKFFIRKNRLTEKTEEGIEVALAPIRNMYNGTIPGLGTLFNTWCEQKGRDKPSEEMIEALNLREINPWILIKESAIKTPSLWTNWCTFYYSKGSFHV
jgi:hypothetical protein